MVTKPTQTELNRAEVSQADPVDSLDPPDQSKPSREETRQPGTRQSRGQPDNQPAKPGSYFGAWQQTWLKMYGTHLSKYS